MSPQRRSGLGTNQEAIRRHNLGTLLRHVHGAGQISRAELTSLMGLNRSTIGDLTSDLVAAGLLREEAGRAQRPGAAARPSGQSLAVMTIKPNTIAVPNPMNQGSTQVSGMNTAQPMIPAMIGAFMVCTASTYFRRSRT